MEYKRCTFQLGLQARNVNKSEKNHNTDSTALFREKKKRRKEKKIKEKKKGEEKKKIEEKSRK